MKCKTGLSDYKFGTKNNWRRRVWNEAIKRIKAGGVHPRDAVALYLPGPEDLDREVAKQKGFLDHNLWCCERDKSTHDSMREKGNFSINLPLSDAVLAWPKSQPLNFIFADVCCGITDDILKAAIRFIFSDAVSQGCVVCINMMRGREIGWGRQQLALVSHGFVSLKASEQSPKHRGAILFDAMVQDLQYISKDESDEFADILDFKLDPLFLSYKSRSGIFMDSVIFSLPMSRDGKPELIHKPASRKFNRVVASARAMAAVRTMRLRGSFPSSRP